MSTNTKRSLNVRDEDSKNATFNELLRELEQQKTKWEKFVNEVEFKPFQEATNLTIAWIQHAIDFSEGLKELPWEEAREELEEQEDEEDGGKLPDTDALDEHTAQNLLSVIQEKQPTADSRNQALSVLPSNVESRLKDLLG